MLPEVAVIFTAPLVMPLATPPALIETTPASDELHCTEAVKSVLLPSENVPNAENCCVDPGEIDAVPGEICNPVKVAGVGVGVGVGVGDGVGVGVGVGVGAGVGVGVGVLASALVPMLAWVMVLASAMIVVLAERYRMLRPRHRRSRLKEQDLIKLLPPRLF